MVHAIINDEQGITHLTLSDLGRGKYKKQLKELNSGQIAAIEIPLARAAEILADGAQLSIEAKTPFPNGTAEALRHLGMVPRRVPEEIPSPTESDPGLVLEGHNLHEEPEIRPWLPPEKELKVLQYKVQGIISSQLQLSETQRADQLVNLFRSAAQAFFTPAMKKLYGVRLWRMAEFFERTGRARPAMIARAEARRLFHDAPGVTSRFAEFLFEKVMYFSQLVKPPEGAAKPATGETAPTLAGEKRSPGGLILP